MDLLVAKGAPQGRGASSVNDLALRIEALITKASEGGKTFVEGIGDRDRIGSNLVAALIARGNYHVVVCDAFGASEKWRNLAKREPTRTEASLASEFEAAELLTLGLVYEGNLRFGGGAYSPVLRKVDRLTTKPLPAALRERTAYAARLQEIDNEVKRIVGELQARGMKSPYLRSYVVARINPVRFHKMKAGDKKPAMPIAQALLRMHAAAKKFDLGKVNMSDLAFVAAGAESAE